MSGMTQGLRITARVSMSFGNRSTTCATCDRAVIDAVDVVVPAVGVVSDAKAENEHGSKARKKMAIARTIMESIPLYE